MTRSRPAPTWMRVLFVAICCIVNATVVTAIIVFLGVEAPLSWIIAGGVGIAAGMAVEAWEHFLFGGHEWDQDPEDFK